MKNLTAIADGLVVVIDLREVIKDYVKYKQFYELYSKFPLKDIISFIISISPYESYSEALWLESEKRLGSSYNDFDIDILDIFFDTLAGTLDEQIRNTFPKEDDYAQYVLHKWINSTTVVLVKDGTVY